MDVGPGAWVEGKQQPNVNNIGLGTATSVHGPQLRRRNILVKAPQSNWHCSHVPPGAPPT